MGTDISLGIRDFKDIEKDLIVSFYDYHNICDAC